MTNPDTLKEQIGIKFPRLMFQFSRYQSVQPTAAKLALRLLIDHGLVSAPQSECEYSSLPPLVRAVLF